MCLVVSYLFDCHMNITASSSEKASRFSYPCPNIKYKQGVTAVHYNDQNAFAFDSIYCPTVDYIANLETIDDDLEFLLFILNSPELNEYYITNGEFWNVNVFGGSSKTKYIKFHSGDYQLDSNKRIIVHEKENQATITDVYNSLENTQQTQNFVIDWFLADFLLLGYNMSTLDNNRIPHR